MHAPARARIGSGYGSAEVVGSLAINPNTVLKAYRELDREGLVEGRRGQGTFVTGSTTTLPPDDVQALRDALERWLTQARAAGLDEGARIANHARGV